MIISIIKGLYLVHGHEFLNRPYRPFYMVVWFSPATFNCMGANTRLDLTSTVVLPSENRKLL